jgi:hypothetical protein
MLLVVVVEGDSGGKVPRTVTSDREIHDGNAADGYLGLVPQIEKHTMDWQVYGC